MTSKGAWLHYVNRRRNHDAELQLAALTSYSLSLSTYCYHSIPWSHRLLYGLVLSHNTVFKLFDGEQGKHTFCETLLIQTRKRASGNSPYLCTQFEIQTARCFRQPWSQHDHGFLDQNHSKATAKSCIHRLLTGMSVISMAFFIVSLRV
jgi:hypothetical protein